MAETEGGTGGKARSKKIDSLVDQMVRGTGPSSSGGTYTPPKKKPPYVPSETERKTRQYGAPISPPIARMKRGQRSDHMNKYA